MIKVILPTHLYNRMSDEEIMDICNLSCSDINFYKEEEMRGHNSGQYIKLFYNNIIKYVCLSREDLNARNAFILQNFPTAYQHFIEEENKNKVFEYYIRYFGQPHPPYVIFSYKILLTAGIKILNIDKVVPSSNVNPFIDFRTPFLDLKQMRSYRFDLSQRNSENNSTTFEEENDNILIYGKTYGANGRETAAISLALSNLSNNKKMKLYLVNERDEAHLASIDSANKAIFDSLNMEICDNILDFEYNANPDDIAKRDTPRFHYNLLQKFHEKKCYLCNCDIEKLIIGSHIHRVTDIIHSTEEEIVKKQQIIDRDNGFWLCANHDKLFEWGFIYFENDKLIISDKLNNSQREFVKNITFDIPEKMLENRLNVNSNIDNSSLMVAEKLELYGVEPAFHILKEHYNENMHKYLEKHKNRVLNI